jgi:protein O-mannosyl-transferase
VFYAGLGIVAFTGWKKKSIVSFSIAFFMIAFLPTSNIIFPIGAFMGERFMYVASIGFVILVAYFFGVVFLKMIRNISNTKISLAFILLILAGYSLKTISRNSDWKDNYTLFTTDVRTSYNSFWSNAAAGQYLLAEAENLTPEGNGDTGATKKRAEELRMQAFAYLQKAVQIHPNHFEVNYMLGNVYGKYFHDLPKSIFYLERAVAINGSDVKALMDLGVAYGMTGKLEQSNSVLERAIALSPENSMLYTNVGVNLTKMGRTEQAHAYFVKAEELKKTGNPSQ